MSGFWPHPNSGQVHFSSCDHGFPVQPLSRADASAFLPNSPFPITMPVANHPVTDYLVNLYSCNSAPHVEHLFGTFQKYASNVWNHESNLELLHSLLIRLGTNMILQSTEEDTLNNDMASKGVISSILIVEQYRIMSNLEDAYVLASKKLQTIYDGNVRDTYKFYQKRVSPSAIEVPEFLTFCPDKMRLPEKEVQSCKKGAAQGRRVHQLQQNSRTVGIVPVYTMQWYGSLLF